ncbi:MAG: hypothetical protein AABY22_36900 [Nanoarchaeota archaeon]
MNQDKPELIEEEEKSWKRDWSGVRVEANVNGKFNCWSEKSFVEGTEKRKGTYGDLLDKSAELSSQRAKECGGQDPKREQVMKDYEKKCSVVHPQRIKDVQDKTFEI